MNTVFRNMRLQHKKLERLIADPGIRAVSFDLFDTLLLRPCCAPEDIFTLVQLACGLPWDLAQPRMLAAQAARKHLPSGQEEATLDEIYVQLQQLTMISGEDADRIKETELAVEKHLLQINAPVYSLYQEAVDSGKKVILCSDMYLPEEFLRQILSDLSITGFHKLYLSGTYRASKLSGSLYHVLLDDLQAEGVAPAEVLHVGDSGFIDYRQAKKAGIRAFHLRSPLESARRFLFEPPSDDPDDRLCTGNSCLLGTAINLCTAAQGEEAALWVAQLAAACEIAADSTPSCAASTQTVSELIHLVKNDTGLSTYFHAFSEQFRRMFPCLAEMTYDVETLREMLLIRGIFLPDDAVPDLRRWKSRHHRVLEEKRLAAIHARRPSVKQIVKAIAWRTGLFPVMSKIYHRLKRTGSPEPPKKSEMTWPQIRQLLQSSLQELKQASAVIPSGQQAILYLGHIAAFDKGVCGYMNRVAEQMPDYTWLLLSETPNMTPEEISQKIHFPVLKIPRGPFAGGLDFGITPDPRDLDSSLFRDPLLSEAAENICAHFPGTTRPYADCLVQYFHKYCTHALQILHPVQVVIWNQFVPFHQIMAEVCRKQGIPCVFMEFGSLAGTFALDHTGQMGESTAAIDPPRLLNIPVSSEDLQFSARICHYLSAARLNRNPQPQNTDQLENIRRLCRGHRVVVFFGQSDYEAGLFPYSDHGRQFHSPFCESSLQAMQKTAAVCRRHNWKLIYKPHPAMNFEHEQANTPADVLITGEISIFDLFSVADAVVTIASQCSYEALLHQIPVVMMGYNQLKGKHCTYEAFEDSSLDAALSQAVTLGFTDQQKEAFFRHTAQMLKSCLYDDESQRPVRYGQPRSDFINELLQNKRED